MFKRLRLVSSDINFEFNWQLNYSARRDLIKNTMLIVLMFFICITVQVYFNPYISGSIINTHFRELIWVGSNKHGLIIYMNCDIYLYIHVTYCYSLIHFNIISITILCKNISIQWPMLEMRDQSMLLIHFCISIRS